MKDNKQLTTINKLTSLGDLTVDVIKSADFNSKYELLLTTIAELEKIKDDLNSEMKKIAKDQYQKTGEGKISSDRYTYLYCPGTTRETIDTKRLKAEDPDLYKKYVKVSGVSESFKVLKKEEVKEIEEK